MHFGYSWKYVEILVVHLFSLIPIVFLVMLIQLRPSAETNQQLHGCPVHYPVMSLHQHLCHLH